MDIRITFLGGLLLLLLACASTDTRAQSQQVALDLDHAAFAYSDSTSLVELYFAFGAAALPFEPADRGYQASIPVRVTLAPVSNESESMWRDSLAFQFTVGDTADIRRGQMFLQQLRAEVPPGSYRLTIDRPETAAPDRSIRAVEREIVVGDFTSPAEARFSEIALASRIQTSNDQDSPFFKHGLLVRPNPRAMYGRGLSRLYYYVEMYRAGTIRHVDDRYRVHSYITPVHEKRPIDSLEHAANREVRSPDVLVGQFNVSSLPSGSYELHMEVRDGDGEPAVSQRRKFYVYNPDVEREPRPQGPGPTISARYGSMTEEMVDISVAAVSEIASESERTAIDELDSIEEKREFLTQFWSRRDETPGTSTNEKENQFYRSLRTVREQYGSPFKEAWETDRGRTMLQYGSPSQIDSYLHERETRPYVIWHYDHLPGQGEAQFIFIDREGFGEFNLVHSTARGEIKNPEWRRLIQ